MMWNRSKVMSALDRYWVTPETNATLMSQVTLPMNSG